MKDTGFRGKEGLAQQKTKEDATDMTLFVRTSGEEILEWDKKRIYDALTRETDISDDAASIIAREVEKMVLNLEISNITAPLLRELTNAKLIEYGLENIRRQHTRLGVPIYDAREIIVSHNKENANVPHGPEATNLTLAENIKKEYALMEVFSPEVADAHMRGDIHLHDLGMVDRPYCSGQSIEYVKKFGLNLPNALSIARPAKHPEVLIEHVVKFSAALQGHFAGAIGWDAFNTFLAPYLVGLDERRVKQLAQILVYEFAQQAVARGGQSIFSDLNLYWECPKHFENVEAIGPGGQYTGKTYADYMPEARGFLNALVDVYMEGDAQGRPFFFPKPNVHITDKFFKEEGSEEFLLHLSRLAADKGNTYFVFDRGDTAKISECCRLAFQLRPSDLEDAKQPWKMRYSAMQNVTINLPRVAYDAGGDESKLFETIYDRIELAAKAHLQKKKFISHLLGLGKRGPLSLLAMETDGEPYYRLHRASFLLGMLGLNEMVQSHTGEEMHESEDAYMFGLKTIAFMRKATVDMEDIYGIHMPLEQTPAESTAYRMAKLDMKYYPMQSSAVMKGNRATGEIYYTNSTYMNVSAPISAIERVKKDGKFHPLIEAGALSHIWLGESKPPAESIANFVKKTFRHTQNAQIAFSPEFTSCLVCGRTYRGLKDVCENCASAVLPGVTPIKNKER
ncbi:MAG: anaerobic ribonucleoside-triphosphate reductase [Thermoplasmata archaeon HGW-Thermoplasmata-1]|nr:MAG: anaerobic ribonucleoside-triphosphate reductase [Thermoplasmata archaeon HGW-Thermoplasmata-1]